jgi:hypothetical protein
MNHFLPYIGLLYTSGIDSDGILKHPIGVVKLAYVNKDFSI